MTNKSIDVIVCSKCNEKLTVDDMSISNMTNEYGEEFYQLSLYCNCGHIDIELSQWGDAYEEDKNELFDELVDSVK